MARKNHCDFSGKDQSSSFSHVISNAPGKTSFLERETCTSTKGISLFSYSKPLLVRFGANGVFIIFWKVIGDKKGGGTSEILFNQTTLNILEEIRYVVQVPIKFIHVTRNPFDNIATILLRNLGARDRVREDESEKVREGGREGGGC